MKTKNRIVILAGFLCGLVLMPGCASRIIDAASTKIELRQGKANGMSVVLPKELDATGFNLEVDPATKVIKLKADHIKSSSQGIIESASASQAKAIESLSTSVLALVAKFAVPGAVPVPVPVASPPPAPPSAPAEPQPQVGTMAGGAP